MNMTKTDRITEFAKLSPLSEEQTEKLINWLDGIGFFTAPASTKYHGAYEGGLFDHCHEVTEWLTAMTKNLDLKWDNVASPFLIGMLHDVCKCDQYKKTETGYEYVKDTLLTGHGEKSVMMLYNAPIRLTEEEIVCIRYHMGAFTEKEQWNSYTNAVHKYTNVLWTHQADMLAAHVSMI